jgi:hypothetical protein
MECWQSFFQLLALRTLVTSTLETGPNDHTQGEAMTDVAPQKTRTHEEARNLALVAESFEK